MRLQQAVVFISAGGVGSGCKGPNCGRKPGFGQPEPAKQRPAAKKELSRSERARLSYKPSTQAKQAIADKSETELSKKLGMDRTPDNSPFDLIMPGVGVEVKTLIDNKNDKITMHPESRRRKEEAARKEKRKMFTVVIDKRAPKPAYYFAEGVGAFRIRSMQKAKDVNHLKEMLAA